MDETLIPNEPEFKVERFAPRAPMGWEEPIEAEPFMVREVQQYLIDADAIAMRWDVAYLKDGMCCQAFVSYMPRYVDDPSAEQRLEWREKARALLKQEVPSDGCQFRLRVPASTRFAGYV